MRGASSTPSALMITDRRRSGKYAFTDVRSAIYARPKPQDLTTPRHTRKELGDFSILADFENARL
eukprot:6731605-Pyramimonas_sp.AAC.1